METLYPDPGELFEDMNVQIFGGPVKPPGYGGTANMSGFAANYVTQAAKNNIEPVARDIMQINWCTRRQLAQLDSDQLQDIGVSRGEAQHLGRICKSLLAHPLQRDFVHLVDSIEVDAVGRRIGARLGVGSGPRYRCRKRRLR